DIPESGKLGDEDRLFVESVWNAYKVYSATALVEMSHGEGPWKEARCGLAPDALSDREITHDAMRSWFEPKTAEQIVYGLPVEEAYRAAAEMDRGPGKGHSEVFAALRRGR